MGPPDANRTVPPTMLSICSIFVHYARPKGMRQIHWLRSRSARTQTERLGNEVKVGAGCGLGWDCCEQYPTLGRETHPAPSARSPRREGPNQMGAKRRATVGKWNIQRQPERAAPASGKLPANRQCVHGLLAVTVATETGSPASRKLSARRQVPLRRHRPRRGGRGRLPRVRSASTRKGQHRARSSARKWRSR